MIWSCTVLTLRLCVWYVSESQSIYACADGMFKQERKTQYFQTWRWSVIPNESSRDFVSCDRFWTQLALCCFQIPTFLPKRHGGREKLALQPYETDPTPNHSARPPLSNYRKIPMAIIYMISTGVADYKVHARALLKVTDIDT